MQIGVVLTGWRAVLATLVLLLVFGAPWVVGVIRIVGALVSP